MPRNQDRIAADYARMWATSQEVLALGQIETDPVPDNTSSRWGVSAVFRPTEPVLSTLEQVAADLAPLIGGEQLLYRRSNLHTTVRSIEGQRLEVTETDPLVQQYISLLRQIGGASQPFSIAYRGLTATRSGIMAQGWPQDDTLQDLRDAFDSALREYGLLNGPEAVSLRQTAHASLCVFTHSLVNPSALANYVENHRQTSFGVSVIRTIDVVRYIRTVNDVKLVVFATIPLGAEAV